MTPNQTDRAELVKRLERLAMQIGGTGAVVICDAIAALTAQQGADAVAEPDAWMGRSGRRVIPAWYKKEVLASPSEREGVFDCTEVGMEHVRRAVETYTIPLYAHTAPSPEGVVVPREPTDAMVAAAMQACVKHGAYFPPEDDSEWSAAIKAAMLAAAPMTAATQDTTQPVPTLDEQIACQEQLLSNYQPNPVVTLIAKSILVSLRDLKRIRDIKGAPEPVATVERAIPCDEMGDQWYEVTSPRGLERGQKLYSSEVLDLLAAEKLKRDEAVRQIEQIHEVCMNIADCPPLKVSDTLTLKHVKGMAQLINRLSAGFK